MIAATALVTALAGWSAPRVTAAPAIKPLTPGTSWNWQISSTPTDVDIAIVANLSNPKKMLDIDGENATAAVIAKIKASGIVAICYMETGAIENYRSDYASFPPSTWGKQMPGYPDEHYLDIRQQGVVNAMKARLDRMAAKGCDGIEPDIDDAFVEGQSTTGLPLTESIQVGYDTTLINYAHSLGMSMGLKNGADPTFVSDMAVVADWALNEQCSQYQECGPYSAFISRNKAVFQVEYSPAVTSFCPADNTANFDGLKKSTTLTASPRTACRLDNRGQAPTTTTAPAPPTTATSPAPPTTTKPPISSAPAPPTANLVPNPGFETGGVPTDNWGGPLARSGSVVHAGTFALAETTSADSGGWDLDSNSAWYTPVSPGKLYTASIWVRATATTTVVLNIDVLTSNGGYSSAATGTAVVLTANTWTQLTATFSPVTGQVFAAFEPNFSGATTGTIITWDDMSITAT